MKKVSYPSVVTFTAQNRKEGTGNRTLRVLLNTHLGLWQFAGQHENVLKVSEQELKELEHVEIELF